jgi:hypothetical protein
MQKYIGEGKLNLGAETNKRLAGLSPLRQAEAILGAVAGPASETRQALAAFGTARNPEEAAKIRRIQALLSQGSTPASQQIAALSPIFGEQSGQLLSFYEQGGFGQARQELARNRRLGIAPTEAEAGRSQKVGDIITQMEDTISNFLQKLTGQAGVLDAFERLQQALEKLIVSIGGVEGFMSRVGTAGQTFSDVSSIATRIGLPGTAQARGVLSQLGASFMSAWESFQPWRTPDVLNAQWENSYQQRGARALPGGAQMYDVNDPRGIKAMVEQQKKTNEILKGGIPARVAQ